jgi:hypothetical protein
VTVTPDDYAQIKVSGEIVALSAHHIAIHRHDDVRRSRRAFPTCGISREIRFVLTLKLLRPLSFELTQMITSIS